MRTIPDKVFSLIIDVRGGADYIRTLYEIGRKLDQVIKQCQPPHPAGAPYAESRTTDNAQIASQG